jgi:putative addiction module component (TIGR02574 family)
MDLLLVDTFTEPDPQVEEAWAREIDRRSSEMDSGKVKGIPAEEVMARVRKTVGL